MWSHAKTKTDAEEHIQARRNANEHPATTILITKNFKNLKNPPKL
jgi:hypothetical protein